MRLIDADALISEFTELVRASNNSDFADVPTWNDAVSLVGSAPTIEAEPIVHCKDCKHLDEMADIDRPEYRECHFFSNWATAYYMLPDDGCTFGKRKDEVE